jgi:adenosylmethionine-8-amino-7-oxononanoate aminotransferase
MPILPTFLQDPPTQQISHAIGNTLFMSDGSSLEDYTCGFTGHSVIGWGLQEIAEAGLSQLTAIGHIDYKNFIDPNREQLASLLTELSFSKLPYTFFVGGSGGEACEASIKLSYQAHVRNDQPGRTTYLSRKQSYHGMSSDNLSLGDRPNLDIFSIFHPAKRYQFDEHNYQRHKLIQETPEEYSSRCCKNFETFVHELGPDNIGGVVIETMMGGLVGDVPPSPGYLKGISNICQTYGIHLILDEVWCGNGVSGRYFCHDWDSISPDFVFFGKTLAAGYAPISVLMTTSKIVEALSKIDGRIQFSTTFQGHSVSCAIALAVVRHILDHQLIDNANSIGCFARERLLFLLRDSRFVFDIRGRGIRNSVENCAPNPHLFSIELGNRLLSLGFLVSSKWHRTSILPPMNIDIASLDNFISVLADQWLILEDQWSTLDYNVIRQKPFF